MLVPDHSFFLLLIQVFILLLKCRIECHAHAIVAVKGGPRHLRGSALDGGSLCPRKYNIKYQIKIHHDGLRKNFYILKLYIKEKLYIDSTFFLFY